VRYPEEDLIALLKNAGVDFTSSLPCEKIGRLLEMVETEFSNPPLRHVPLTREEEGVGISAGAALAGKRPAMFVQSSGIGNMLNALLSLTGFYELPLALFVSQRGIYKEKIAAQLPMGRRLPKILRAAGVPFSIISTRGDFGTVEKKLDTVYKKNKTHAFLMSPAIWEESAKKGTPQAPLHPIAGSRLKHSATRLVPHLTRFAVLNIIAPYLNNKVVVCNLGFPSKELFYVHHQPSNFYMLGSMGMATPVGLGVSLSTEKEVVVIDGDGSLLMNPGSLATAALLTPRDLTIFAIDNSAYGSTGNQPTLTGSCVDLELTAKGFGIKNTLKAATEKQFVDAMKKKGKGPRFIHALAVSGNRDVPNIDVPHLEIKKQFQEFLRGK